MVNPMNPSLQQAMYQVPVAPAAQDATTVAPQTVPQYQTNFGASQYAQAEEHKSIFTLRNVLGLTVATTLLVAGVKTHNSNSAFKKAIEKHLIPEKTEFKMGQTFLDHLNPLNWVGRDDAAKELEKHGFQALDKDNNRIVYKEGGDVLIMNGKKARNVKDFSEFKAPEAPKADAPASTSSSATAAASSTTPAPKVAGSTEESMNKTQAQLKKIDNKIAEINKDITVHSGSGSKESTEKVAKLQTQLAKAERAKELKEIQVLEAKKLNLQVVDETANKAEIDKLNQEISDKISKFSDKNKDYLSRAEGLKEKAIIEKLKKGEALTEIEAATVKFEGTGKTFEKYDINNDGKLTTNNNVITDSKELDKVLESSNGKTSLDTYKSEMEKTVKAKKDAAEALAKQEKAAAEAKVKTEIAALVDDKKLIKSEDKVKELNALLAKHSSTSNVSVSTQKGKFLNSDTIIVTAKDSTGKEVVLEKGLEAIKSLLTTV